MRLLCKLHPMAVGIVAAVFAMLLVLYLLGVLHEKGWQTSTVIQLVEVCVLILIPILLHIATQEAVQQEKNQQIRRVTSERVHAIFTNPTIVDRDLRIYLRRKYNDAKIAYLSGSMTREEFQLEINPYADKTLRSYFHDVVVVCNFFEAICTEIKNGQIDSEFFFDTAGTHVVAKLNLYETVIEPAFKGSQKEAYANLIKIGRCFRERLRAMSLESTEEMGDVDWETAKRLPAPPRSESASPT